MAQASGFSSVQIRGPIGHHGDGSRSYLLRSSDDQKALTVSRSIVNVSGVRVTNYMRLKENLRNAGLKGGTFQLHIHCHHFFVWCEIKDFLSIAPPAWLRAAVCGDQPLAAGSRKGLHVHFNSSRLV